MLFLIHFCFLIANQVMKIVEKIKSRDIAITVIPLHF